MFNNDERLHVLLADDDLDDCFLFDEALEQADAPVRLSKVNDGNLLIEFLEKEEVPDVLFLDINMPCKNGIECLKEIRRKEDLKELPIIIYSTTNYKVNIDICLQEGANMYIVKPNTFDEILKMINTICTLEWKRSFSTSLSSFVLKEKF